MYCSVILVRNNNCFTLKNFFNQQQISKMEKQANIIINNPKIKKFTITLIGLTLFICKKALAYSNPFDAIGWKFWGYVKGFGFFACLIMCGIEVIKSLNGGDTKSLTKIIFKYAIAYASFSVLPWIFNELDSAFKVIK